MNLEIIGLNKTFNTDNPEQDVEVLKDINYKVRHGEFISIIGPSGCGKTTLLRIIAGIENQSSGKVLLEGQEISGPSDKIGMVFQQYALFPWRTVQKNIEFGLEIKGIDKKKRRLMALQYIEAFGLTGFENRYPRELSGGMQQRVAIARTLINNPKIVLMDEPFGSVDSQTRNSLQEFLLSVWRNRRETILFVTHNVDEAVFLSDKIIILSRRPGRIVREISVELKRPRDRTSDACNNIRREVLYCLARQREGAVCNGNCLFCRKSEIS